MNPEVLQRKVARLEHKVRLLENMVEGNSRTAFLEAQRRAAINSLLTLSLQSASQRRFLASVLEIVLAQEMFAIEARGALLLKAAGNDLEVAVEQGFPQAASCCAVARDGLCQRALRTGMPLFSAAAAPRERQRCTAGLPAGLDVCVLPVRLAGHSLGVFCLALPGGMVPAEADRQFLAAAADIVASGLQRFRYEEDLAAYQSNLEELVGRKIHELQRAEERYREIFLYSQAGIYQSWLDGGFRTCNPAMARMLGYGSPEEMQRLVKDIARQVYDDPQERAALVERLRQGPVQDHLVRLRRRDGRVIHVLLSARLVDDDLAGQPYIEGQAIDVSGRIAAETALAEERNLLAVTLASIGDGVITTDTEGRVVLCNPVAERLTGWPLAEAKGRHLSEVLRLVDGKSEQPLPDPVAAVLARGGLLTLEQDCVLVARDGRRLLIADSGAPIRDRDGRQIGVVLVFRDVTEQHRLEQEARRSQRLESLGVLAGGIAHDFNNILVAILGNISLAEQQLGRDKGREMLPALLAEARKAGLRARDLVHQLQTFAKGGEPIREAAAIDEVIRESAGFVLRGANVACHYDFAPDLWLGDIDPGQVSQVIQNLVLNAKQAMPHGGTITITCRNRVCTENGEERRFIEVCVADDGPGIPADRQQNIFDPYFTTKKEGIGLGLAIVHSVIRKHGGRITVESEPGKGTRFVFLLPASQGQARAVLPAAGRLPGGSGRILVMDDEEAIRILVVQMLDHLGYEAETVADGETAVVRYREALEAGRPFAAVILDLTVPGRMGGREAGERILALDPGARVVIASGYSQEPVLAGYAKYGFAAALNKPFLADEMASVLAAVLGPRGDGR